MTPAWRHSRQGGRALLTTKEQTRDVEGGGVLGPSWKEEASCVFVGTSCSWSETPSETRQIARECVTLHIRHKNPPLSPAPRLSRIATQYTDVFSSCWLLESAGFWVDSGLSLPARADYDPRTGVMP